jgi:hypothetical protein
MDRDDVAFPDVNEIAPHAIAFARMMFAHAEFERGIRSLVDAINPKEQPCTPPAPERTLSLRANQKSPQGNQSYEDGHGCPERNTKLGPWKQPDCYPH